MSFLMKSAWTFDAYDCIINALADEAANIDIALNQSRASIYSFIYKINAKACFVQTRMVAIVVAAANSAARTAIQRPEKDGRC